MLNIEDPELAQLAYDQQLDHNRLAKLNQHPVLDLPFRAYFLLAVICSIFTLSIWSAFFNGYLSFSMNGLSPVIWHIHEMIFGFAATVAIGFLLTAAQTWTGKASIKGLSVLGFIVIWLLVRVCLLMNQPLFINLAIVLQTAWWLGSIFIFTKLVLTSKNTRNYLFIPLLVVLMLVNISLLVLDIQGNTELSLHFARTAVLLFCLLMGILGGRVIPFFTVSGARLEAIQQPQWLTPCLIITSLLGILVFFSGHFIELPFTSAALMISAGILHLLRQSFWRSLATLNLPLLWSLHIAYASLGIGLILLGISYLSLSYYPASFADAIHIITIGAMGLMIFSMMCRVSLGHTGRALTPSRLINWLFIFIIFSALARTLLPAIQQPILGWNVSALLWLMAGISFLKVYLPVLTSKRINQKF